MQISSVSKKYDVSQSLTTHCPEPPVHRAAAILIVVIVLGRRQRRGPIPVQRQGWTAKPTVMLSQPGEQ